ncbi:MAG TPA: response regulator transcription factor [Fibrobacteria bacterium]|nr:response regulator transcription factor [Fibrobacteria bacterium]
MFPDGFVEVPARAGISRLLAMPTERILVLEDDADILDLVVHSLRKAGFKAFPARTGADALSIMSDERLDLAILDVMLPDLPGTEICRRLRESERHKAVPVVFLTARTEEHDRIYGFTVGGDDYVAKPFSPRELVARVQAILRRTTGSISGEHVKVGELSIDLDRRTVRVGDSPLALTFKEFEVLKALVVAKGRAVERLHLLEEVWGMESTSGPRSVDVAITRLREKLGAYACCVHTVTGLGYQWDPDRWEGE